MKNQESKNSTKLILEFRTTLTSAVLVWAVSVTVAFVVGLATYRNIAYLLTR
jgi:hypothetical protein